RPIGDRPARAARGRGGARRRGRAASPRGKGVGAPAQGRLSAERSAVGTARKVVVLKGGRSLERTVSLRSGAHAQEALARLGHEVRAVDADGDVLGSLLEAKPDVAFIALHGSDGEDGTIQQLLEAIGVTYTGSGPAACM